MRRFGFLVRIRQFKNYFLKSAWHGSKLDREEDKSRPKMIFSGSTMSLRCNCHKCMINVSCGMPRWPPVTSSSHLNLARRVPVVGLSGEGKLEGTGRTVGGTLYHHSSDENWRKMGGHRLAATSSITASRRTAVLPTPSPPRLHT